MATVPTILFNSSTGSNTQASGAGPGTAVFGTNASFAASVVTLDGSPDLSGVSTTGDHVLWLKTSTGRQFSVITAADNALKTVTVADAPAGTSTGRTWGIGGKRSTFDNADSRTVFADWKAGWTIETETDQSLAGGTLSAAALAGDSTSGPILVKGTSASTRPIITQTTNVAHFTCPASSGLIYWENLQFKNSNGTKTSANAIITSATQIYGARNCIFGDQTNTILNGMLRSGGNATFIAIDCEFKYCTNSGISAGPGQIIGTNLWVHNCTSHGLQATTGYINLQRSLVNANGGSGISQAASTLIHNILLDGNTIHGNTSDGFTMTNANNTSGCIIINNNFTANGGYGINGTAGNNLIKGIIDGNNYGTGATANTSGALNNITAGSNDLNVDPQYTNAGGIDFSVGANVKALGLPLSSRFIGANQSATKSYVDIGGAQRQEPAASGGLLLNPGMAGGMRG